MVVRRVSNEFLGILDSLTSAFFRDNLEAPGISVSSSRFPIRGTLPRQPGVPSKRARVIFSDGDI